MPLLPWLLFALLLGYGLVASLADAYTTSVFLTHPQDGIVEGNPVARWMFSKFGESLATWIAIVFYIFSAGIFAGLNYKAGMVYTAAIAALETVMAIRNYGLLKKANLG